MPRSTGEPSDWLRSPFTTLAEAGRYHYPYLPVGLLLADRYPSLERIGAVGCPLLVIAGGADHNDLELLAGTTLIKNVLGFVSETVSAGAPTAGTPGTPPAKIPQS